MTEEKRKFSGMSFGGILQGVTLYGKNYRTDFRRVRKEKNTFIIRTQQSKFNSVLFLIILFPLIDFINALIYYVIAPFLATMKTPSVVKDVGTGVGEKLLVIPDWFWLLFPFIWLAIWFSLLYFSLLRGVRRWHGTEHKVIGAAENDDIDNAKKYSPIHERCGGTLMPTIIFAVLVWSIVETYLNIYFGTLTFVTFCIFINVKYLHKYDKIGIWFGKIFQKYVSIKEPHNWQLNLGKIAMKNLILAEDGKEYQEEMKLKKEELI